MENQLTSSGDAIPKNNMLDMELGDVFQKWQYLTCKVIFAENK